MLPLLVRSFLRITVDTCILPGTMTGSEILWLYMVEWKKSASAFSICLLALFAARFDGDNRKAVAPASLQDSRV